MKHIHQIILLVTLLLWGSKVHQPAVDTSTPIHPVEYLASEELSGRYPGTKGDSLSAIYIRNCFREAQLELLANEGYQLFEVTTAIEYKPDNFLKTAAKQFSLFKDFQPMGFSGNGSIASQLVFAGYGFNINDDSLKWNDYAQMNVRNRWVLAFRMDPDSDNMQSPFALHAQDRHKAMTATDQGAAGLLLVNPAAYEKEDNLEPVKTIQNQGFSTIPVLQVIRETGKVIQGLILSYY